MSAVQTLGKYEIRRQLGRGAAGIVFEGWDPAIERRVAIKTVRLPDTSDDNAEEDIARFRREARTAGQLTHPNIVGVFDYGETDDIAYIVMEFIDGSTLKALLDTHERIPLPRIGAIMEDLLAGLAFSHDRGVVHRDIKPANLMLTSLGAVKIADFGIARIESSSMTMAGTVLGTPSYMSPEQFLGQQADARTDIYAAGVVLYQLLTGARPFDGSMHDIRNKVLTEEAPLPSSISLDAPPIFDAVVRRAMARQPDDRFNSAMEFATALRDALAGRETPAPEAGRESPTPDAGDATMIIPAAARETDTVTGTPTLPPVPPPYRVPEERPAIPALGVPRAKPLFAPAIIGGAVAVLALVGGIGYFLLSGGQPDPPVPAPDPIPRERPVPAPAPLPLPPVTPTPAPIPPVTPPPAPVEPVAPAPVPPRPPPPVVPVPEPIPIPAPRPAIPAVPWEGRIAALLRETPCSALVGELGVGVVEIAGVASKPATDRFNQAFSGLGIPDLTRLQRIGQVSPAFCSVLDMLRPITPPFGDPRARLSLRLRGDPVYLRKDNRIEPLIVMGDLRGRLTVDYIVRDKNSTRLTMVYHLYPQVANSKAGLDADPPREFEPGDLLKLGEKTPGHQVWEVDGPYGTDMIVAIASEQPLFARPRPDYFEPAEQYLRDLKQAIEDAKRREIRVEAAAVALETRLK